MLSAGTSTSSNDQRHDRGARRPILRSRAVTTRRRTPPSISSSRMPAAPPGRRSPAWCRRRPVAVVRSIFAVDHERAALVTAWQRMARVVPASLVLPARRPVPHHREQPFCWRRAGEAQHISSEVLEQLAGAVDGGDLLAMITTPRPRLGAPNACRRSTATLSRTEPAVVGNSSSASIGADGTMRSAAHGRRVGNSSCSASRAHEDDPPTTRHAEQVAPRSSAGVPGPRPVRCQHVAQPELGRVLPA